MKALLAIVAVAVANVAARAEKSGLLTEVIPEKQTVRLGDPIVVSVSVTNQSPEAVMASRSATAFDCFEVTDPDGQRLLYIGFDGQVVANLVSVPPFSRLTIAEAIDLTDKYLFRKPGRYAIRFSARWTDLSDSSAIAIEVAPGRLSEFDNVVASLLSVRPDGWHVAKDGRGEVAPFGCSRVPGFAVHVCHNHMRGEAVLLWFTKEEAKVDPDQQPRAKVDYLGRARELFVYGSVGSNAPALWPTATEDISHALHITK